VKASLSQKVGYSLAKVSVQVFSVRATPAEPKSLITKLSIRGLNHCPIALLGLFCSCSTHKGHQLDQLSSKPGKGF